METNPPGLYRANLEAGQIIKALQEAVDAVSPAMIWMTGQTTRHHSTLYALDVKRNALLIKTPLDFPYDKVFIPKPQSDKLPPPPPPPVLNVSIVLKGLAIIGFQAAPTDESTRVRLCFPIPTELIVMQRRKNPRWEIPKAYEYYFNYNMNPTRKGRLISRKLCDISENGFSFEIYGSEKHYHPKERVISEATLTMRSRPMTLDVIIRGVRQPSRTASTLRVGVEIVKISEQDQDFLKNFLAEQFVQYAGITAIANESGPSKKTDGKKDPAS